MSSSSTSIQPGLASKPPLSKSAYRRLIAAAAVGTAVEQYDFFSYAFVAPLAFDTVFFPKVDPHIGTIMVYATFAIGFIARPFGGIMFGHFGDRFGRKSVLMATLLTMGIGSFLIGCLPTYASIGIWAAILLVLFRFLQGLAQGGEYMSAVVLTLENAPTEHRGFYQSTVVSASEFGPFLAALLMTWLGSHYSRAQFQTWVWRIPFLLSFILIAVGAYFRSHVDESVLFVYAQQQAKIPRVPIAAVLRNYKKPCLISFFLNVAMGTFLYLSVIFLMAVAVRRLSMPQGGVSAGYMFGSFLEAFTVVLLGRLSDRWGRRPYLLAGIACAAIGFPLLLKIMMLKDVVYFAVGITVACCIVHALMYSQEGVFCAELFPTEVRVTGASLGKNMGTVLGGGIAPLVATALMGRSLNFTPVLVYFWIMCVCAFVAVLLTKETNKKVL